MSGHQDPSDAQRAFNSLRAQKAAHARWAKHDPRTGTAPARAAFMNKFVDEAREQFPDLPESEIQRRAESARRAYMCGIALKGLKTRRKNAERRASLQRNTRGEGGDQ